MMFCLCMMCCLIVLIKAFRFFFLLKCALFFSKKTATISPTVWAKRDTCYAYYLQISQNDVAYFFGSSLISLVYLFVLKHSHTHTRRYERIVFRNRCCLFLCVLTNWIKKQFDVVYYFVVMTDEGKLWIESQLYNMIWLIGVLSFAFRSLCFSAEFFNFAASTALFLVNLDIFASSFVGFNYYNWRVLWLKMDSLNFRCGGVRVDVRVDEVVLVFVFVSVPVFVSLCVSIVVGTDLIPLLRFVRMGYFNVPKGCLQISFFTV